MGLFGQKPMYSVAATKKQHEREAPTEGVRGGRTGSEGKERRITALRVTALRRTEGILSK